MVTIKNVSARAFGIFGNIVAPEGEIELTDDKLASVQDYIDAGELELVGGKPAKAGKAGKGKKEAETVEATEPSEDDEIQALLDADNKGE